MINTHETLNQAPPREGVDEYATNVPLVEAVARWGRADVPAAASPGGPQPRSPSQNLSPRPSTRSAATSARPRSSATPNARTRTRPCCTRTTGGATASTRSSTTTPTTASSPRRSAPVRTRRRGPIPGPGANVDRAAAFFLFAQVEPGHACPVSMTHAAVPTLELAASGLRDEWMPRLLSRAYEPGLGDGATKASALIGMAMTEKQGGSDVRANTTRAEPTGVDDGWGREFRLTGHKWFCSAPMSDAFLVLAQAPGGLELLLRAARAARRHAQRVPHPAAEGQARQPVERVERDRARRHGRRGSSATRVAASRRSCRWSRAPDSTA